MRRGFYRGLSINATSDNLTRTRNFPRYRCQSIIGWISPALHCWAVQAKHRYL